MPVYSIERCGKSAEVPEGAGIMAVRPDPGNQGSETAQLWNSGGDISIRLAIANLSAKHDKSLNATSSVMMSSRILGCSLADGIIF